MVDLKLLVQICGAFVGDGITTETMSLSIKYFFLKAFFSLFHKQNKRFFFLLTKGKSLLNVRQLTNYEMLIYDVD